MRSVIDDDQAALDAALAESDQAALDAALAAPSQPPAKDVIADFAPQKPKAELSDHLRAIASGVGSGASYGGDDELAGALGGVLGEATRSLTTGLQVSPVVAAVKKAFPSFAQLPDSVVNAMIEGSGGEIFRRLTGADPETNPKAFADLSSAAKTGANAFTDAVRDEAKRSQELTPGTHALSTLAGAFAAPAPLKGVPGEGFNLVKSLGRGGTVAGTAGFLSSEGGLDWEGIKNRLKAVPAAATIGAALDSAIGKTVSVAPGALKRGAEYLAAKASIGDFLDKLAQSVEDVHDYGRFALDKGLLSYFGGPASIAKRAQALAQSTLPGMKAAFGEADRVAPQGMQVEPVINEMVSAAVGNKPYNLQKGQFAGALGITKNFLADTMREAIERDPNILKNASSDVVGNVSEAFMPAASQFTPEAINNAANSSAQRYVTRMALRSSQPTDAPNEALQRIVGPVLRENQPELGRELANEVANLTAPNAMRSAPWSRAPDLRASTYDNVNWGDFQNAPSQAGGNARASAGAMRRELERQLQPVVPPELFNEMKAANSTYGMARDIAGASGANAVKTATAAAPLQMVAAALGYGIPSAMGAGAYSFLPPLALAAGSRALRPVLASAGAKGSDQLAKLIEAAGGPVAAAAPALEQGAGRLMSNEAPGEEEDAFETLRRSMDSAGRSALGAKAFVDSQLSK